MKRYVVFWTGQRPGCNLYSVSLLESATMPRKRMTFDCGLIYLYDRKTQTTTLYGRAAYSYAA